MTDKDWDTLLGIRTEGRDDARADNFRYPYEPTPYCVLERLTGTGLITRKDHILDYGCGKGRVGFYLSWQTRCRSIGIDFDQRLLDKALENRRAAVSGSRTDFILSPAETFRVPADVNRIYFFNPFSDRILVRVLGRIRASWYASPRKILLFFYYPSDEYLPALMGDDLLAFEDSISCGDLFPDDPREEILVFSMGQ